MGRAEATIEVELAWSPCAGDVQRRTLVLPGGATIADAVAASGWELPPHLATAVWGRLRNMSHRLRSGDRLELLRPLLLDPKEARRLRGARRAAPKKK